MSDDLTEFRVQLGRRIAETVAKFPTKAAAAQAADLTVEQLGRWVSGTVKVPVEGLWRLSRASGIDFCWLCTGQGPEPESCPPGGRWVQKTELHEVLVALVNLIMTDRATVDPNRVAELVLALHDYLVKQRAKEGASADLSSLTDVMRIVAGA